MPITNNKQRGFTMIEVLIAAFVLAIGLLGLAGLQAQSLQFNYSAYQRSQASLLAYSIIDRIRANPSQASINTYDFGLGNPPGGTDCQVVAANCSTTAMANFDITQWKCSLGKLNGMAPCSSRFLEGPLADGDGSIDVEVVAGPNGNASANVTVTIQWLDNRTIKTANVALQRETFTVSTVVGLTQ